MSRLALIFQILYVFLFVLSELMTFELSVYIVEVENSGRRVSVIRIAIISALVDDGNFSVYALNFISIF